MLKINSKTYFVRVQLSFILRKNPIFLCLKGKWEVLVSIFSTTLLSPTWFPSGELGIILNLELVSVTSMPCHWYCGSFLHGDQAKAGYQGIFEESPLQRTVIWVIIGTYLIKTPLEFYCRGHLWLQMREKKTLFQTLPVEQNCNMFWKSSCVFSFLHIVTSNKSLWG